MSGSVTSAHHQVFHHGSSKQRQKLKYGTKYGPIKEWPSETVELNKCKYINLAL